MKYYLVTYNAQTPQDPWQRTECSLEWLKTEVSGGAVPATTPQRERIIPLNKDNQPRGFICPEHLEGFLKCAEIEKIYISVRETGLDSLTRIPQHYACKPHDILEKTLKPKSIDAEKENLEKVQEFLRNKTDVELQGMTLRWLARASDRKTPVTISSLESLPTDNSFYTDDIQVIKKIIGSDKNTGLVMAQFNKVTADHTGLVGWWFDLELSSLAGAKVFKLKVPMGILHVEKKSPGKLADHVHGATEAFGPRIPKDAYTGDYDLHCIFKKEGEKGDEVKLPGGQAHSITPRLSKKVEDLRSKTREATLDLGMLTNMLNFTYLASKVNPKADHPDPRERNIVTYDQGNEPLSTNLANDRYANPIQHGPQNLYHQFIKESEQSPDKHTLENAVAQLELLLRETNSPDAWPQAKRKEGDAQKMKQLGSELRQMDMTQLKFRAAQHKEVMVHSLLDVEGGGVLAFAPVKKDGKGEDCQEVYALLDAKQVLKYYEDERLNVNQYAKGALRNEVTCQELTFSLGDNVKREKEKGNTVEDTWINRTETIHEKKELIFVLLKQQFRGDYSMLQPRDSSTQFKKFIDLDQSIRDSIYSKTPALKENKSIWKDCYVYEDQEERSGGVVLWIVTHILACRPDLPNGLKE